MEPLILHGQCLQLTNKEGEAPRKLVLDLKRTTREIGVDIHELTEKQNELDGMWMELEEILQDARVVETDND